MIREGEGEAEQPPERKIFIVLCRMYPVLYCTEEYF